MITLSVNGRQLSLDAEDDTPLLWALREDIGMTGTKFGCGAGLCGACTVHIDGEAMRSCQVPVNMAQGRAITTIEGLGKGDTLHAVQAAWVAQQVPQCGYCQPGMIMAVAALLKSNPHPDEGTIKAGITNLCRCGTYPRIVDAIIEVSRRV